jgi:hypothetical protein
VGSLNWLAISALPEISFRVMILSTQFGNAEVHDMKKAAKLLHTVSLMDRTITFPAMGRTGTLKIRSFGDAAFGNIPYKDPDKDKVYSTVGKLVCLKGEGGTCNGWILISCTTGERCLLYFGMLHLPFTLLNHTLWYCVHHLYCLYHIQNY